ncbi:conserved protein of unknown function [Pseudodesulfovibrio profundus]|uniref:Solute-binding protein family 3/N-terminal domain-containing protein n=1 Tax=Pseudodesulfovibrio profundus TaxID=57320 RepID=A0A2C8FE51_9BACT|nr:transporter substrate-binding domain-containing protein [Pseudodesulfovibrio profundus]SOB60736.1 conserved protein of unknown function [Pseudodesulfovibrio profundus]
METLSTRIRRTVIAMALSIFVLLATGGVSHAEQPMRVVCDTWPPYQITRSGQVSGFAVEVVEAMFEQLNVSTTKLQSYPWKRALSILEHGHADALFSANYTRDRTIFAHYPDEPLVEAPWVVWTRDDTNIRTMEDLKGKRVGVVLGYSYTPAFWTFIETFCDVEQVSTDEINMHKLEHGRLDAMAAEYGNGLYLSRKLGFKRVTPLRDLEIKSDGLYIIFNKETVEASFVDRFSQELTRFKETETYSSIYKRYFE